jgi:hypothetical protein
VEAVVAVGRVKIYSRSRKNTNDTETLMCLGELCRWLGYIAKKEIRLIMKSYGSRRWGWLSWVVNIMESAKEAKTFWTRSNECDWRRISRRMLVYRRNQRVWDGRITKSSSSSNV